MTKTGILLHVYNLYCDDWEKLVWGEPTRDKLGVGTKLLELLMTTPINEKVRVLLCSGPSMKDGMNEGEYTYKYLHDRLDRIGEFPALRNLLSRLTPKAVQVFRKRVEGIVIGEDIENTYQEILQAASLFELWGAEKVIHVAAASHAPRCIQLQAAAREAGLMPAGQQWFTVASDLPFSGRSAKDTVVVEPPHRADDPLIDYEPTMASILRGYFALSSEGKQQFIQSSAASMKEILQIGQGDRASASKTTHVPEHH